MAPTASLSLAFMGTPDFSLPALAALQEAGHRILGVYTQPPRPAGRGHRLQPSPVHRSAQSSGIPVFTPKSLRNEEETCRLADLRLDAIVVVAYGLLLPREVLRLPDLGCINIHASLLPRWRGAAPIQRALLAGDRETGITIMKMEEGLDSGPVLLQEAVPIGPRTTAGELHDTLAALGARLVLRALDEWPEPRPQPATGITYAPKIERSETRIDWRAPASAIERQVRAFTPAPGSFCTIGGERVRVIEAALGDGSGPPGQVLDDSLTVACGEGALELRRLQRQGKKPLAAREFLRGYSVPPGTVLE